MRFGPFLTATVHNSFWEIIFWIGLALSLDDYSDEVGGCVLPASYYGTWHFLTDQGILSTMKISKTSIDIRGRCRKAQEDRYLFVDVVERNVECWRYMFFYQKHENVILFKESRCFYDATDEPNSGDLTDALMFTLIRVDAKSEPCPLKVPFHFNYSNDFDSTRCYSHPSSRVDVCSTSHRVKFTYEPCADSLSTDSAGWKEEIECLATWEDDQAKKRQRFVARLLNFGRSGAQYRCFVIEKKTAHKGIIGRSADSSCRALDSIRLDYHTYHTNHGSSCKAFAHWLIHDHADRNKFKTWQTLGSKVNKFLYAFRKEECTIYGPNSSDKVFSVSRCVVERLVDENFAEFIVQETVGCASFYKCIRVYRRTDQIVQLFTGLPSNAESYMDLCQNANFVSPHMETLSLVLPQRKTCPFSPGLYQTHHCGSQDNEIDFGCKVTSAFSLNRQCKDRNSEQYACIGSWSDMEVSYLVAQRIGDGDSYCIKSYTFLQIDDTCDRSIGNDHNQSDVLPLNASFQNFCDQAVSNPVALSSVARNMNTSFLIFIIILIFCL